MRTRPQTDMELQLRAREALKRNMLVASKRIRTDVRHGTVRLEGEVDYRAQRQAAEDIVRQLDGVLRIDNAIGVRPPDATRHGIDASIQAALAQLNAADPVEVTVVESHESVVVFGGPRV